MPATSNTLHPFASAGLEGAPQHAQDPYPKASNASTASSTASSTAIERWALSPQGFTAIGPIAGERKSRDWSLVLQSAGIWHVTHRTMAGFVLLVRDQDYERASQSIDRYEAENRDWPPKREREKPRHASSETKIVPYIFIALALFFLVTGPVSAGSHWFQRGTSVTELVLHAQPWRAVTALTLHADAAHVLGNVVSGAIFASAVASRLGTGGALLATLASGTLGNAANAIWHQAQGNAGHASIGASTAVFGAVGLLAATQLAVDRSASHAKSRHWTETLSPVVGGLALLGALGASPNSDLGAHLFGFLSGGLFGLPAALYLRIKNPKTRNWVQVAMGALFVLIIAGSWQLALGLPIRRIF